MKLGVHQYKVFMCSSGSSFGGVRLHADEETSAEQAKENRDIVRLFLGLMTKEQLVEGILSLSLSPDAATC
jgi:hypothetical protein